MCGKEATEKKDQKKMNISETNATEIHAKMCKELFLATLEKTNVSIEVNLKGSDKPRLVRKLTFRWVKTWRGQTVIGVNMSTLCSDVRDIEDDLFFMLAIENTSLEGFTDGLADLLVYLGTESGLRVDAGEIKIESGIEGNWRTGEDQDFFNTYQVNRLFANGVLVLTYDFWTETEGPAARFKRVPWNCISGWESDKYDRTDQGFIFFDILCSNQNEHGDRKNPMKEIRVIK